MPLNLTAAHYQLPYKNCTLYPSRYWKSALCSLEHLEPQQVRPSSGTASHLKALLSPSNGRADLPFHQTLLQVTCNRECDIGQCCILSSRRNDAADVAGGKSRSSATERSGSTTVRDRKRST